MHFEAPEDPEALTTPFLTDFLPSRLVHEDWESAVSTTEALKHDFGRLQALLLEPDSSEWRRWNSEQLSPEEVTSVMTYLAKLEVPEAWRVAYSLQYVVGDYYDCLLDDEKLLGHLLRRHDRKSRGALLRLDEDELYDAHVRAHVNDFGHHI